MRYSFRHSIVMIIILSGFYLNAQDRINEMKWEYSSVVFVQNDKVIAEDRMGNIIAEGKNGIDDSYVIQSAIDISAPAGEIKITTGKYYLDKTLHVNSNNKITGSGRGTVLIPPINDFAIKVEKAEQEMIPRPYHSKELHPLYAVIITDITIDGERDSLLNSGKGIYLSTFWSSSFMNLWIQNTGNAITLNNVHECDFQNIYLINNGNAEKKEAGFLLNGRDNIHISGLYVIYQNYIGLQVTSNSKLIFITNSMFHGWNKLNKPNKYPLISIQDINDGAKKGDRLKSDVIIENCRITVGGEGTNVVDIANSPVTIRQCVASCGWGDAIISAVENSRVNISDNTFYSFKPLPTGKYVLYGEDSEVIFKNNVVSSLNLQVSLKAVRNSIIADNRFEAVTDKPNILLGDKGNEGCRSIQVKGNIFRKEKLNKAVEVEPYSTKSIEIHDNQLWSE